MERRWFLVACALMLSMWIPKVHAVDFEENKDIEVEDAAQDAIGSEKTAGFLKDKTQEEEDATQKREIAADRAVKDANMKKNQSDSQISTAEKELQKLKEEQHSLTVRQKKAQAENAEASRRLKLMIQDIKKQRQQLSKVQAETAKQEKRLQQLHAQMMKAQKLREAQQAKLAKAQRPIARAQPRPPAAKPSPRAPASTQPQ